MQIGQLFILRINIHLQGSVLDSPELMWAEPQLEPIYGAVRSYLEMDQRVGLLTERLDVIADLLAVLKDQVRTSHGEYLEWIGEFSASVLFLEFTLFVPIPSPFSKGQSQPNNKMPRLLDPSSEYAFQTNHSSD